MLRAHQIVIFASFIGTMLAAVSVFANLGPHPKETIIVSESHSSFVPSMSGPLEEFAFVETKEIVRLPNQPNTFQVHLTDIRAVLKTASVAVMKDFLFVQYVRGCQFESTWNGSKEMRRLNVSREHFGRVTLFKHASWEIDSDTTDPSRASFRGDRHALWRWNSDPASLDPATSTFFSAALPPHPVAFWTDLPSSAFRLPDSGGVASARNSSLEYRTCLFRIKDVPKETDPAGTGIDIFQAVHCFAWNHKFIYNFRKSRFESPQNIDPICL